MKPTIASLILILLTTPGLAQEAGYTKGSIIKGTTSPDGKLALELLKEDANEIALALLDYNMPGLDGLELGLLLDEVIPEAQQILCTANSQAGLQKRAEEQGLDVLHKPITAERLADCIENNGKDQ